MSGYRPPPGQFDDTEIERRIQEEIRRRTMQQVVPFPTVDHSSHPGEYSPHISMQQQAAVAIHRQQQQQQHGPSPYPAYPGPTGGGAIPHGHSPYARVGNPYAGMADARAAAAYQTGPSGGQLAQMYAVHQERQHHANVSANNYAAAAAAAYGAAPSPLNGGHPGMDHHYAAAYKLGPPNAASSYGREASYGSTQSPHPHPQHIHSTPVMSDPYGNNHGSSSHKSSNTITGGKLDTPDTTSASASTPTSSGSKATPSTRTSSVGEDSSPSSGISIIEGMRSVRSPSGNSTPSKGRFLSGTSRSPKSSSKKPISSGAGKEKNAPHGGSSSARLTVLDGKTMIEDGDQRWYTGCIPLGLEDDKYWLSELQVYLRSNLAEAFGATEDDIAAPMHGRNKPIALGQVGIRCMHCKHDNPTERGQQATSYPSLISGIYNSVQQLLRLHLEACIAMPPDVRTKIEQLRTSCSSRGGRKQYWIDSAKRLGLVDTPHGIHFGRDPTGPLPPLAGPSVNSKEARNKKYNISPDTPSPDKDMSGPTTLTPEAFSDDEMEHLTEEAIIDPSPLSSPVPPVDARALVFPVDKSLISDYLYLTLEQMAPCLLMEADRVGCYKTRKVGFPGLACKHCVGQAGCGRYFPASEASLSQTTTSQTIMNHVRNCRRCPNEVREGLEIMKRNRMGPDGKKTDKPKHGGRKVFFHRLWCRIQNLPFEVCKIDEKESKKSKKKHSNSKKKKSKSSEHDSEGDSEEDDEDNERSHRSSGDTSQDETDSEDENEESGDESVGSESGKPRKAGVSTSTIPKLVKKPHASPWYNGCVRLTKTDDPHWLSEMECFARSDLVEVFSYKDGDTLEGYAGRREPTDGQVGIRCVFCKSLDPSDRNNGCIAFPETLSSIHSKIADMTRLHFNSCPTLPDGAIQTFKAYRGFDAKTANDDSLQYWVDSARDIGLSNLPPAGPQAPGAWGITFRRDPLQPSPADELDLEQSASNGNIPESAYSRNSLVRLEDRGFCTDQVMLLLRQVRPCRFQANDRRAGPGSRGRDRAMGFPGLCCMHCQGKNTLGRYFPVSSKNLTDSTTNSLHAHVSTCGYTPEKIKASLAYLGHRSILQKAELSGSWKKAFFKKVWDRLHTERGWKSMDDDKSPLDIGATKDKDEEIDVPVADEHAEAEEEEKDADDGDDDAGSESDNEEEELDDQMNILIKAAAIWLTEQDNAELKAGARSKKSLPTMSLGRTTPLAKRRRVHF